jgi:hypothetical protein
MVPLMKLTRYTGPAREVLALAEGDALADSRFAISTGDMLLALASVSGGTAASALSSLGITAGEVRRELAQITRSHEDGASSYGISREISFTRMGMGVLSHTTFALRETGHAEDGQPRTPTGPYLCTGEMLLAIIGVFAISDVQPGQGSASDARQLLSRLGVERSAVFNPVVEQVRRSPADEQKLQL